MLACKAWAAFSLPDHFFLELLPEKISCSGRSYLRCSDPSSLKIVPGSPFCCRRHDSFSLLRDSDPSMRRLNDGTFFSFSCFGETRTECEDPKNLATNLLSERCSFLFLFRVRDRLTPSILTQIN